MIKKKNDAAHKDMLHQLEELKAEGLSLTDTHAHIHFPPLSDNIEAVLDSAYYNGIGRIITVGIDYDDSVDAIQVADKHFEVYATVGVHPHDANDFDLSQLPKFEKLLENPKVVGVGEIGLDFYRNNSEPERQEEVLLTFLDLAISLNKPVIIHNRDASERCIEVLDSVIAGRENNGVIHCFSGDRGLQRWALDNGFYISYAGPVTYSSAEELRKTVEYVPLDRLLVETDCPYLAPVPYRGKVNEPSYVVSTAYTLANIKGVSLVDFAIQTEKNVKKLFGIK